MRTHGIADQILTDKGKLLTCRFGKGPRIVLFDLVCRENCIKHLLTAPRSPTTTGKVKRFHKTLRREFLNGKVYAGSGFESQGTHFVAGRVMVHAVAADA